MSVIHYYNLIKQMLNPPTEKKTQERMDLFVENTIESRLEGHRYTTLKDLERKKKEISKYIFSYNF